MNYMDYDGFVAEAIEEGDFAHARRLVAGSGADLSRSERDGLMQQIRKAEANVDAAGSAQSTGS